ncbi:hypothetical protein J4573_05895 [Actinomadura barringtoniae]|uniref:Uncharacterized protein n=1 Tax=Actinomadura barringtoniae TaxID=1427535 RepID=A0A939PCA1_9ACTN|nr:hypothetical protein [Actinomadura barringtoniae]MBO2446614.1 hypothetical protein [Actinomadura barringtoniae]
MPPSSPEEELPPPDPLLLLLPYDELARMVLPLAEVMPPVSGMVELPPLTRPLASRVPP